MPARVGISLNNTVAIPDQFEILIDKLCILLEIFSISTCTILHMIMRKEITYCMIIRKSTSKNTQETCSRRKQRREIVQDKHLFAFQLTKSIKLDILNVRLNYFLVQVDPICHSVSQNHLQSPSGLFHASSMCIAFVQSQIFSFSTGALVMKT